MADSWGDIHTWLSDVTNSDYWTATEGNAKRALYGLLSFAKMRPDGIWDGD